MTQMQTPISPQRAVELALEHHRAGRLGQAEAMYRQILASDPANATAMYLLARLYAGAGRQQLAIPLFVEAARLHPQAAEIHLSLGNALDELKRPEEAMAAMRRAIAVNPRFADAHHNLGNQLRLADRCDEAEAAFAAALEINPAFPEGFNGMGAVWARRKDFAKAIPWYRKALALRPDFPDALNNLGTALTHLGQIDEAIASYRKAVAHAPDLSTMVRNLAMMLLQRGGQGDRDEAMNIYVAFLQRHPQAADVHLDVAIALLAEGEFGVGWREYEWRWGSETFLSQRRQLTAPLWRGEALNGRTLLLHSEQGLGDTLQFIRYAPLIHGGIVLFLCAPEFTRLLGRLPGLALASEQAAIPRHDFHCPLMSLPYVFGTQLTSIPAPRSYLQPEASLVEQWASRMGAGDGRPRVGLAWAGQPSHGQDHLRSIPLSLLAPLGDLPGVQWFSLQKGEASAQTSTVRPRMDLVDLTADITDWADTAALVANLDLVISVDTAIVHLAGAMGKPTWVLLQDRPDWRWLLHRTDSPWYPSVRLFRQTKRGDWMAVLQRVKTAIEEFRRSSVHCE